MKTEDSRANSMLEWLDRELAINVEHFGLASSDASFRRYFRIVSGQQTYIVMDAPPERENIGKYIKVARLLALAGINVPAIFNQQDELGFVLLEDFGNTLYLDKLRREGPEPLYRFAFDSLFRQQAYTDINGWNLPSYDRALLERELDIFDEWFLGHALGVEMPDAIRSPLYALLIDSALEQPTVFVHRDYHSRNLMVVEAHCPGVLDFQDAVVGPITYDLVSLLKDCYIRWPETSVEQWRQSYWHRLREAGIVDCGALQFKRWFDLMGLQRHLKAIGIFSRLNLRDGKPGYLSDIPRTLTYVDEVCAHYPELAEFRAFLQRNVLPRIEPYP
ncbi:MAG: aminoglycoside phosphotransferase family protein [Gammaproteobacteria bacterium]